MLWNILINPPKVKNMRFTHLSACLQIKLNQKFGKFINKVFGLIFFLLLFFLVVSSDTPIYAATYYVSPSGSNTSPYDTWEKAANLPSSAITAGNTVAETHTMYIAPGEYTDHLYLTDSDWTDGTILGTSAHGNISPATKDQIIISEANFHTLYTNKSGITIKYLSATGTGSTKDLLYINGANFTGEKLHFYNSGRRLISLTAAGADIKNSILEGANDSSGIYIASGGAGTFSYNLITNSTTSTTGATSALANVGTGTVILKNNIISGSGGRALYNSSTGTITATNNILLCGTNSEPTVLQENGTVNLTNNILIGHWYNHYLLSGTIATDTNNIKNYSPGFVRRQRSAYLVPAVDDAGALSYAQDVETELASEGVKGTYYIWAKDFSSNKDVVQTILDNGTMSIGVHSYSHSWMSLTGNVYSITKDGATINVDRDNDQIVVDPGGTVSSFRSKSLATIQAELEGFGATVGSLAEGFNSDMLGEAIADSSGAQGSPYTPQLLIDTDGVGGLFKTEMVDAKSIMESSLTGYTGKSFSTPGGATSADAETAMKNTGFLRNRNTGGKNSTDHYLNSVDMFGNEFFLFSDIIGDSDDDNVRANSIMLLEFMAQHGVIMDLLSHSADQGPIDEWSIFLDEAENYTEVSVTSSDEALDEIINSGDWSTADQITYTRTWTDQADYSLQYTSPGIDAGTDVSLTEDYAGNSIYGLPDIGAYEYQPPYTMGTDEITTSTTIRTYGDEKFRNKTAPSGAETADLSVTLPDTDRSQWLDIEITTWENTGTRHKNWTETTTVSGITNTIHVVGDLTNDQEYNVKVDDVLGQDISGDDCTDGVCSANSQGEITFTYGGSYSSHTFDVEESSPAPTPTPTPAPTSTTTSVVTSSGCSDQPPGSKAPWLYGAIAQDSNSVMLYFTEADGPVNKYVLEYGTSSGNYQYGVQNMGVNLDGQMNYLVRNLSSNTTYYFRVRAGNGCATGNWSNEISVKTGGLFSVKQLKITSSELVTQPIEKEQSAADSSCQTYIVKSGDNLWNLAVKLLGDGNKYKEIIEQNKDKYPSLEISNNLDAGWELRVNCKNNQAQENPSVKEGYNVKIKVTDESQKPVEGATVTLHSNPQTTKTDKNGIALFRNVEQGDHKVLIAYSGHQGEQSINLAGDVKEFSLNVTIKPQSILSSPTVIGIIAVFILLVAIQSIYYRKKYKH